jgi:hypothetical protein
MAPYTAHENRRSRDLTAVCCSTLLQACVSTSEVVPAGKDSYMIVGSANGGPVAGKSIIAATKQANAYCEQQGKVMEIRNTSAAGIAGFGGEHSNLIFSCLDPNDP